MATRVSSGLKDRVRLIRKSVSRKIQESSNLLIVRETDFPSVVVLQGVGKRVD